MWGESKDTPPKDPSAAMYKIKKMAESEALAFVLLFLQSVESGRGVVGRRAIKSIPAQWQMVVFDV